MTWQAPASKEPVDRDTAATFLFAGHDTTANLMTWVGIHAPEQSSTPSIHIPHARTTYTLAPVTNTHDSTQILTRANIHAYLQSSTHIPTVHQCKTADDILCTYARRLCVCVCGGGVSWLTFEMARNPDLQRRLQEEVDDTFASLNGRDMTYADLPAMTFLTRCITETLRL